MLDRAASGRRGRGVPRRLRRGRHETDHRSQSMTRQPILFCYDGSEGSRRAIERAAELLTSRDAIVVDVGQVLTGAESLAALSPGVDVSVLQNLNEQAALVRAEDGAAFARRFGFDATPRGVIGTPT